jgi:hypothetical protein
LTSNRDNRIKRLRDTGFFVGDERETTKTKTGLPQLPRTGIDRTPEQEADSILNPKKKVDSGLRLDKTRKGKGFLGTLQRPDGGVSTELSIGVDIDGKETLIPSIVSTSTKEDLDFLLSTDLPPSEWPQEIIDKAVAHARKRISQGLSSFK